MKTPRDLLFDRHRSADSKLDAIRRSALAALAQPSERENVGAPRSAGGCVSWGELLRSFRWHLAGMSAAWLLVALLNIDHSSGPAANLAQQHGPSPQQLVTALRENRRQLLEWIQAPASEAPPPPRNVIPQRRGELRPQAAMV